MITDKEVRALAARLSERTALRYMGNCKCGHCALVDVADLKMAVSVLTELAATHKPGDCPLLPPGWLQREVEKVRDEPPVESWFRLAKPLPMPPYEYQPYYTGSATALSKPCPDRSDLYAKIQERGPPTEDDLRAQRESWVRGEMGWDRKDR
jgi:hypothetical protein